MTNRFAGLITFKKLIWFMFAVAMVNIYPQQQGGKVVLTLEDAIKTAKHENYDIQLASLNVQKSQAQIDEAYAGAFPKLDFSGNYTRNLKLPVLFIAPNTPFNPGPTTETFSIGADNSYNLGVSLSQTIYDPRLGTAISIAKKYSKYSDYAGQATEDDVVDQVKRAFYTAMLAKKLVEVNQAGYDVAKANLDNTEALYKQGVSSEYDYLRAQVQLANVEPALIEAKNNLVMAKNSLKNLLGYSLDTELDIIGEFKVEQVNPDVLAKSDEILKEKNPTIQSLGLQQSILEENIDIEKAAYLPTLSAFGNYAWQAQDNTFKFGDYIWAKTLSVGLSLTYTLFDGFKRGAKIQQAEIDAKSLEVTKTKTEEGLRIALRQSKLKMEEALDRIKAQEKSIEQAEKALKIAQSRYKNGVGTQLEILDTQNSLTQTRVNYEKAIYDYLIAKSDWEKLLGISE